MSLPSFSMQSPDRAEEVRRRRRRRQRGPATTPTYATAHPTGTGPFKFEKWDARQEDVTLDAQRRLLGREGQDRQGRSSRPSRPEGPRRRRCEAGEIDGYDLVGPADIAAARRTTASRSSTATGVQHPLPRHEPEARSRSWTTCRSARRSPTRSTSERSSTPRCPRAPRSPTSSCRRPVDGYTDDVTTYDYDPEKAKELLKRPAPRA